jgi:hypothetical protein
MYNKGFIACCKVNGQILREDSGGIVQLPFGAEYSVLLKNLNSLRAQVKVSVDGTDATEGTWLIVPANGQLELERYIRNGNFEKGNKFKFIERTAGIEKHKGVGAEDGLIRVEYKSEVRPVVHQTVVQHVEHVRHYRYPWRYYPYDYPYRTYPYEPSITWTCGGLGGATYGINSSLNVSSSTGSSTNTSGLGDELSKSASTPVPRGLGSSRASNLRPGMSGTPKRSMGPQASSGGNMMRAMSMNFSGEQECSAAPANTSGITVPGTESSQRFVTGAWFKTEDTSHVIVLQLRGMIGDKQIVAPVTVKTKKGCSICESRTRQQINSALNVELR